MKVFSTGKRLMAWIAQDSVTEIMPEKGFKKKKERFR
jgi:hypothetical protein